DAAGFHDLKLGVGGVGPTRDERAGVAHALARRRRNTGDEADHGFLHVVFGPLGGIHLVRAADFADHDDRIGIGIVVEQLEHVDVLQAVDGVAADAHGAGLAQAELGDLRHGFVRERARATDDADAALAVDVAGHDADLDFVGGDEAGAVRAQQQRLAVLGLHAVLHVEHVAHGNAFGNADDQVELGFDGFPDGGRGARGRNIDDRNGGARFVLGVLDATVDGHAFEIFAGALGVDASHERGLAVGIFAAHAGMELARLARDALGDDFGV